MNKDCQSVGEETCKSYQKGPHISSFLVFNHPISGVTTPSVKQKDTWKWRDQIWIRASRGVFNVVGMGLILSHTQFNQCGSWVLPSLFLSVGTDVWVSHAKTFILLVKYHHVCTTSPWYTPGDTHDQSHIVIVYIYIYLGIYYHQPSPAPYYSPLPPTCLCKSPSRLMWCLRKRCGTI